MQSKITNLNMRQKLTELGRHEVGDGLWLKVMPKGAYWVYRYRANNVERETSLGPALKVTLAEAHRRHTIMRGQVAAGVDPRPPKERLPPPPDSFDQAVAAYLAEQLQRGAWSNEKHRWQWGATLARLPQSFREKSVAEIGPADVYEALRPMWTTTPVTAARVRARVAIVLDSVRGPDEMRANPAAWEGWLKRKLGDWRKLGKLDRKTGERVPRTNYPSLPYEDVPAFMARLKDEPGVASRALEFAILTAARTTEAIATPWSEINLNAKEWKIPAQRMKMRKEHRVPLSDRAVEILREREAERGGSEYVFASPRGGDAPLSDNALLALLRRMKVRTTAHGFRASFRNWATEVAMVQDAVAERCLAHVVGNQASKAYDTSDRFALRRPLMQLWADYCAGSAEGKVVPFKRLG